MVGGKNLLSYLNLFESILISHEERPRFSTWRVMRYITVRNFSLNNLYYIQGNVLTYNTHLQHMYTYIHTHIELQVTFKNRQDGDLYYIRRRWGRGQKKNDEENNELCII